MSEIITLFGANLKHLREEKGLSQADVASKIGKKSSYVSQLESGTINTTLDTIEKLADALGVEKSAFLEDPNFEKKQATRADLILSITGSLPSLDDSQMRLVLDLINGFTVNTTDSSESVG